MSDFGCCFYIGVSETVSGDCDSSRVTEVNWRQPWLRWMRPRGVRFLQIRLYILTTSMRKLNSTVFLISFSVYLCGFNFIFLASEIWCVDEWGLTNFFLLFRVEKISARCVFTVRDDTGSFSFQNPKTQRTSMGSVRRSFWCHQCASTNARLPILW